MKTTGPHLHVAIVCFSRSWGGLELILTRIATALVSRGHSILLVSPHGSPLEKESLQHSIPHRSLEPRVKYLDVVTARKLAFCFKGDNIDIVVAALSKDISTVVLTKLFSPHLRCVYIQQMQFGRSKRGLFHRLTYRNLDAWITLTESMKKSVVENTIVPADRISVIPFGVDIRDFNPKRFRASAARKHFGLSGRKMLVGVIGRFDKQKGQADLLRAARAVLAKTINVHFVLIGEETRGEEGYLRELQDIIARENIGASVTFMPFTSEVPRLLRALDVLVVPSHSESFGYVAVEAMAMGIPVLGTNAGGLPEIVVDQETGFLVRPRDPAALAERLVILLKNKSLRSSMGKKGRRRALEMFDFARSVEHLEEILVNLATP